MSQQDYKKKYQEAALVEMDVRQYADQKLASIESGNVLKTFVKVIPESQFPNWATTLATMLCTKPEHANLSNKDLVALIENDKGETGLDHTILSKPLSAIRRHLVSEILRRYGYATDTLVKGTDIKRIIKNNIRTERLKDDGVIFYADGLSFKNRSYKYKQRECTPTGKPWTDFCIRTSGQDIKLQSILFWREISIGEFQKRDEEARAIADPDQLARRQKLDREPEQSSRFTKFISADSPNKNGAGAVAHYRSTFGFATASPLACETRH